ncbi:TPA: xanthine dehydrogenase family protein molybdopterin-binding subunit [Burkholderia multivorans]|uniref:xanthine dehydrogenase family protein molybdopterin-binding subunit n=1 Tax=Burkholderia multivorans TaxID=87883 RepID=UPI00158D44FC|nr:xanthine dehydrogenase family protein molybdopterin-binding subunit [Burkholderia multivorans]MBU9318470.1 xanthine dehydrogenase family protein molybdopterin-binding subunit [Burkholderia multivorans]MDN7937036.1 xanthine dehydrogenase family protein molybdopterin-binding subunit [Burkholderia multivorans]HEF4745026.1 xanthine dehydrogenase family protein molybdopterin-binding subunit [Burkholderia multivorans]
MTIELDTRDSVRPSRRTFLKAAGAAAAVSLTIGFEWAGLGRRAAAATAAPEAGAFAPNAFLRVTPDGAVTVIAKHVELGQGAYTGIATIVAEELDADWSSVRVESAPADAKRYANLAFGTMQGTGGSSAMSNSWQQLREAGGKARAMLVSAAAARWNVPASELTTANGVVTHAKSGKTAAYGTLVADASKLPVPDKVVLKQPADFKLIGHRIPRVDASAKSNGTAHFTLDTTFPGMRVALLQRPPRFGATVKSFDATAAKAVPGVVSVVQVPGGIAVVGMGFWAAKQGRDALKVEWDETNAEKRGSDEIMREYRQLAAKPGASARKDGDADAAIAGAARRISASYEFPYLAHAPMEPLDAVVKLTKDSCEIWAGDQFQTVDQGNAAKVAGLKPEQVQIHTLYAGGSFGRRANAWSDYVVEAVSIAKALGADGKPVKLQWTREDDIQGGFYRPMYFHKLDAGLTADGRLVGWRHRIVGQSILAGTPFEAFMVKNGIDATSVEGAVNLPYAVPNVSVELTTTKVGLPVLWWRVVGSSHTAYAVEAFIDEAAYAAGKDPYLFRRDLLAKEPRMRAVLELAAQKAGWDPAKPLPKGRGRGIAVAEAFKSYVAQVAEVSVDADGKVKVERVVCAVDCGIAINPDIVAAQMEGGIGFGLGAAMHSAITLKDGRVEQRNFDGYQVLRMAEMPKVEVHIVPSAEAPTGVGEPGVAPVGPAVANAIFAATGKRHYVLPFDSGRNASA